MTITRKHLNQLVKIYKDIHLDFAFKKDISKNDVMDLLTDLKFELENFGRVNCKNFDSIRFGAEIIKAENNNKIEDEAIQKTVNYVHERNKYPMDKVEKHTELLTDWIKNK